MHKLAMVSLTQARYPVKTMAAVFGVHPNYLSALRKKAQEHGSSGLVKTIGRPATLSPAQLDQARRWVQEGVTGQEIAQRLQVSDTMISRLVGPRSRAPKPVYDELAYPEPEVESASGSASGRLGQAVVASQYAGAMWRASQIPGMGPYKVFFGTKGDTCQNGA